MHEIDSFSEGMNTTAERARIVVFIVGVILSQLATAKTFGE